MDLTCNDWRTRGACVTGDLDDDPWTAHGIEERRIAQHYCLQHCPVLRECEADTRKYPYRGVVAGGIIWSEKPGIPIRTRRAFSKCDLVHPDPTIALAQVA